MPKTLESTPVEAITDDEVIGSDNELIDTVVAELSPRSEIDQDGLNRTIFEYGDISFSFMGRDETPKFPSLEDSKPTLIARPPAKGYEYYEQLARKDGQIDRAEALRSIMDNAEEFWSELSELGKNHQDKPEHLLVEQSAYGVFGLLAELDQGNQSHWQDKQEETRQGEYDQETLGLTDSIIAVNTFIASRGFDLRSDGMHDFVDNNPSYGEAITTLAILGNDQAKKLVLNSLEHQNRLDDEVRVAEIERNRKWYIEDNPELVPFKPEDLMIVHATGYRPEQLGKGEYDVQTTYDATDIPRATIHTTIGHLAGGNLWRTGEDAGYVLMSPFNEMLEANGEPRNVRGIDTWWSRNPGEKLTFKDATLIAPSSDQQEIFTTNGNEVTYKSANYKEADLDEIASSLGEDIRDEIIEVLDEKGASGIEDESIQQIVANIIKKALVHREITEVREKPYLTPDSPAHYMHSRDQNKIGRMVAELGLGSRCALHMGSIEYNAEVSSINGERIYAMNVDDPKVRRTTYASGLMSAGGLAKKKMYPEIIPGPDI